MGGCPCDACPGASFFLNWSLKAEVSVIKRCISLGTLLPVLVFCLSVSALAQTPTPKPRSDDDEIIKVQSRLVVIPVSVTNANGEALTGLKAQDFRVEEENKPQTIDSLGTADVVPLEIALLFDVSASTDAMFKFEQETAAKFLQDVMRPKDRASIFTVGAKGVIIQNRDTAERSIQSIRAITPTKEQTAFYDSVRAAAEYLKKNAPEGTRKVMLIISDGEDTNSEGVIQAIWDAERKVTANLQGASLRELRVKARDDAKVAEQSKVLKSLQDADTVFYSINPGGSSFQLNQISVFGQQNMQRFADETGGTAFLPKFSAVDTRDSYMNAVNVKKNQELLEKIFRQLANELRSQYLIQYYSESNFPVNRYVKLKVSVYDRTGSRVRAREGYYVKN
jgi:Ca-activated chloride channel family protein